MDSENKEGETYKSGYNRIHKSATYVWRFMFGYRYEDGIKEICTRCIRKIIGGEGGMRKAEGAMNVEHKVAPENINST